MIRVRYDGRGRQAPSQPRIRRDSRVDSSAVQTTVPGVHASQSVKHLTRANVSPTRGCTCAPTPAATRAIWPSSSTAALAGGVDIVQLRDKGSAGEREFGPMEVKEELAALAVIGAAARRHGALLAVNDRADVRARRRSRRPAPGPERPAGALRTADRRTRRRHRPLHEQPRAGQPRRDRRGRRLLLHRSGVGHPHQAGPGRVGHRTGSQHRRGAAVAPVVRDRWRRPRAAAGDPRGRGHPHRRGPRHHRGRRPEGRRAALSDALRG